MGCSRQCHIQRMSVHFLYFIMVVCVRGKGKVFPYSLPSVGPGVDPGVQTVSLQVALCHPPGGRLPLLSARPAVTFPAKEHHRPSASTKLYCFVRGTWVWTTCPRLSLDSRGSNLQPLSHQSDAFATRLSSHPCKGLFANKDAINWLEFAK